MALMPVDDALERLLAAAKAFRAKQPLQVEVVSLLAGLGRVLAHSVMAPMNVPPARNSAMDGYAFRLEDALSLPGLPISQRIPAGSMPQPLLVGTAARIFTGGVIPDGADSVAMQENCQETQGCVQFLQRPQLAANIRAEGEDIALGSIVLRAGMTLGPAQLGLLASLGLASVTVLQRVRVALVCSGDELVAPGKPLSPGKIYNSNETLMTALLQQQGCEVLNIPAVADDLIATRQALMRAVEQGAHLILSTGGVSVGEEDHIRAAVQAEGMIDVWKVAIKPGKPLAFGQVHGIPFMGLPGNPQSVWVTSQVLALPFIRYLQGNMTERVTFKVPAGFERLKPQGRREYLRVRVVIDDQGQRQLQAHSRQGSGVLSSASWADGFAVLEAGCVVEKGEELEFYPI